jgi:hypothetical protein
LTYSERAAPRFAACDHTNGREVDPASGRSILTGVLSTSASCRSSSGRLARVLSGVACLAAGVGARPTQAAASGDNGPWLNALASAYVLLDVQTGDLDGDGRDETVACYRYDLATTNQASGIAVLQGAGPDARPVFQVELAGALCEKVRVASGRLGILLHDKKQLAWTYGKEIIFRKAKNSPVAARSVTATTHLDAAHTPDKAYDNDLATSWAEGGEGTGIGQTLSVRLERPVDVAAVALLCGDGNGQRSFFDRNRIHRGSVETKTEADLGDSDSGVDFSSLGIATIGDRIDFACENKPQIVYVRVNKRDVVELGVRIDSVYLGDKKDDTHVAEVWIVPVLDPSQTVDRARTVKTRASAAGASDDDEGTRATANDAEVDAATKKLDEEGGRSVISDDF